MNENWTLHFKWIRTTDLTDLLTAYDVKDVLDKDLLTAYDVKDVMDKDLLKAYDVKDVLDKD